MKPLKIKNGKLVFPLMERVRYFFEWMHWKMLMWTFKELIP